jgi:HSP20 family protein
MNMMSIWNPLRRSSGPMERRPFGVVSPLRELEAMQQRMDELFRDWPALPESRESLASIEWSPAVDITEDDKEYLVKVELPEVKKEDVKVAVEDGALCITGERKAEKEEKGRKFHRVERSYGRFERSFTLPDDADPQKVTSQFKDGLLQVHVAKGTNARSRSVNVKVQ